MITTLKTCFKCQRELPVDSFYRHPMMADGRLGKCKECTKKDTAENRYAKHEKYLEYDRERAKLPHRIALRNETIGRRQRNHPDRAKANQALTNALKSKKVVRPCACWSCGSDYRIEGHHADYSNPLGVTWLCVFCHKRVHAETARYLSETNKEQAA